MKKWILRLGLAVVALVIVGLVVVFFSLNSIVKKGVETVGPKLTQVEIKLGGVNLSPFSGSGQLSDLFVGNPEGYQTPSAIKIGSVKVAVDVGSLMSDTIKIKEINLQAPEITLEGGLSGNNLSKILANVEAATSAGGSSAPATTPGAAKKSKTFYVQDVVIEGGKINLSTGLLGGKALTVPLPPIHLQNIGTEHLGVTAGELVKQILQPLLQSVVQAAGNAIGNVGKDAAGAVTGEAGKAVNKVGEGLKGLFKK